MPYEIYAQPKDIHQGAIMVSMKKRFFTVDKKKAFSYMDYLNANEPLDSNVTWRIAIQVTSRIIFDVDNEDIENVKKIVDYYSNLFGKTFHIFKSHSGYHIYSEKYTNEWDWHFDCCRVLNPLLESAYLLRYLAGLSNWYKEEVKKEIELNWNRKEFVDNLQLDFTKSSGLYCGYGDFDVLFSIMVLFKGYYCIRITKKNDSEKLHEVLL